MVNISSGSQKKIRKYWLALGIQNYETEPSASLNLLELISLLDRDLDTPSEKLIENPKIEFILVSLQAELLQDLFVSMKGHHDQSDKNNKNSSEMSKFRFFFLTASGILVTACQGFDGILTLLSMFSLSPPIMLGAGLIFTLLSVIIYFGGDLVKVSNILGVQLSEYRLLDAYLMQLQKIKAIRKKINDYILLDMSASELQQLHQILGALEKRFQSLKAATKQFEEAVNSNTVQMAKTVISGVSALLYFGSGFFAGQSVSLFVSSLALNSTLPISWIAIIFSVIVGLAAVSVYWYVERPGLEKLVTQWFGLNEEIVEKLCDEDLLAKEEKKLAGLREKVVKTQRFVRSYSELKGDEQLLDSETTHRITPTTRRRSTSACSFFMPPMPPVSMTATAPDHSASNEEISERFTPKKCS